MQPTHYKIKQVLCQMIAICILLLSSNTLVKSEEGIPEINSLIVTFQNLAILDANAAMEIWASEDAVEKWKQHAESVLGDPGRSGAFFDPAIPLSSQIDQSAWIAAFFNPWINTLLVLKVERLDKALQITDFDLILLSKTAAPLSGTNADKLSSLLSLRVQTAQNEILSTAGEWTGSELLADKPDHWGILNKILESKVRQMRGALSWEGDPAKEKLRIALSAVTSALRGGENTAGLSISQAQPMEWRRSLHPAYLDESGVLPVIVMYSRDYPKRLLWIRVNPEARKPVIEEQILTIQSSSAD